MPDPPTEELWIREKSVESVELAFKVQNILFSGRSQYQQVEVIQTVDHGRMLVLDGSVMFTERDEFIYHEMIAHVPLFVHPEPKNVLVVGGGDGGTVREILKHRSVERVVMVEIDPMVVEACRKHIPSVSSALDDPRLELCIEDAVRYVAASKDTFDIAIVDSTDPVGPGVELFGRDFYRNAARLLGTEACWSPRPSLPFMIGTLRSRCSCTSARSSNGCIFIFTVHSPTRAGCTLSVSPVAAPTLSKTLIQVADPAWKALCSITPRRFTGPHLHCRCFWSLPWKVSSIP